MPPKQKFNNIEFSSEDVEQWTPDLLIGQGFRCSRGEFVTFWKKGRVRRDVESSLCTCWIIRKNDDLAGYITLSADKLSVTDQEPLLGNEDVPYQSFPAVKIGLLAGDNRAKGVGKALMLWSLEFVAAEISPKLGVRFMTVDALHDPDNGYDVSGYYANFGFQYVNPSEPLPPREGFRTMYFDLLPLIKELESH
jgi:hypothetical protein